MGSDVLEQLVMQVRVETNFAFENKVLTKGLAILTGEKSEPFGPEALTFSSRLLLQRDVEITIESVDRTGGFIGTIYSGGVDVAEILAREGLARLDQYASVGKALMDAEEVAKSQRKNVSYTIFWFHSPSFHCLPRSSSSFPSSFLGLVTLSFAEPTLRDGIDLESLRRRGRSGK